MPYYFPGPILRRMTAEQLWDSMISLVLPDVDATIGAVNARAEATYESYEELTSISVVELAERAQMRTLRTSDPEKYRAMMQGEVAKRQEKRGSQSRERRQRTRHPGRVPVVDHFERGGRPLLRLKDEVGVAEAFGALTVEEEERRQQEAAGIVKPDVVKVLDVTLSGATRANKRKRAPARKNGTVARCYDKMA